MVCKDENMWAARGHAASLQLVEALPRGATVVLLIDGLVVTLGLVIRTCRCTIGEDVRFQHGVHNLEVGAGWLVSQGRLEVPRQGVHVARLLDVT